MKGLVISEVVPGSIAAELGLEAGDRLVAVNGTPLRDLIDYDFLLEESLLLEIVREDGELWEAEVELEEGESLGLRFEPPQPLHCGNRCIFCFVDQLPAGLRAPLYVKDEDYRLSFLFGNYVTLSNMRKSDFRRIVEQRLSPLYVSVHATDAEVRARMLGRRERVPVLERLRELAAAGISLHTQVVMCPGINDGEILRGTVADLAALFPAVRSLALVPVGLTAHRQGLYPLLPVSPEYAAAFLQEWEPEAQRLWRELGEPFLFSADEFYLKARRPFPSLEFYGDFPQIENGVGMLPLFVDEAREVLRQAKPLPHFSATLVTGASPSAAVREFAADLAAATGVSLDVVVARSGLFGDSVTVTGLVAGGDVISAVREAAPTPLVVIPDVMLREGEGIFLDDMSIEEVAQELAVRVVVACSSPRGILEALEANAPSA